MPASTSGGPIRCCLFVCAFLGLSRWAAAETPAEWIDAHLDEYVKLYQHFHSHPELSFLEAETAARLAQELSAAGYDVTTGVGGHGLVAMLRNGDGPTVMWRTDLDALPVIENTGLDYASKVRYELDDGAHVGVMHACGHDIHITNLIAVARFLSTHRDLWSGSVMFI